MSGWTHPDSVQSFLKLPWVVTKFMTWAPGYLGTHRQVTSPSCGFSTWGDDARTLPGALELSWHELTWVDFYIIRGFRGFRVEMAWHDLTCWSYIIMNHHEPWKQWDCYGLWLFSVSKCWKHLEDSVIFPYHFILRHIRYARVSVERPAVRSETKYALHFPLNIGIFQVVGISQFVKKIPEISAPGPQMDFTRFFPGWKTHPKWVRKRGETWGCQVGQRGRSGADRNTGVKGEVSAELSDFRCVFLDLRPSNMLRKRNWNPFCLRKVELGPVGPPSALWDEGPNRWRFQPIYPSVVQPLQLTFL